MGHQRFDSGVRHQQSKHRSGRHGAMARSGKRKRDLTADTVERITPPVIANAKEESPFAILSGFARVRLRLLVDGVQHEWRSSEALFQTLRFSDPDVQRDLMNASNIAGVRTIANSPTARAVERSDWRTVSIDVMTWVTAVKFLQSSEVRMALAMTKDREIVDLTRSESFWGMIRAKEGNLIGGNHVGRILMQLRDSPDERILTIANHPHLSNNTKLTLFGSNDIQLP
jgi:ribA/ribD-fused uncharacterized protein